jgi:transposase InsO family protein
MAWGEIKVEDQRKLFVKACLKGELTIADLCRLYEISRDTGYKWLNRFKKDGLEGLKDKSRAPLVQACATDSHLEKQIIDVRIKYPTWGPKKVRALLVKHYPKMPWPSTTTIGNLFDKHGLTVARKYRRRVPPRTEPLAHCQQPNDVWCMDFKGYFMTPSGDKCDPFTLTDACSRFLIRCVKLDFNRTEQVWSILDAAFREYGLPLYLRSDNGPPFASCAPGRLSKISINLIKAGVIPEYIEPGKPQQNGRHERMHLTLKNETATPPEKTLGLQKVKFQEFQEYFNFIRPHEALNQKVPADVYRSSERKWDGHLRSPEYLENQITRKVMISGCISWKGKNLFVSETLSGEYVGVKESLDGNLEVKYGPIILGTIAPDITFNVPEHKKRRSRKV